VLKAVRGNASLLLGFAAYFGGREFPLDVYIDATGQTHRSESPLYRRAKCATLEWGTRRRFNELVGH
jgi:hypothetical protein